MPAEKIEIAEAILGEDLNVKTAWEKSVENSRRHLPGDQNGHLEGEVYNRFNLSVAYYNVGDYQKSVEEFEKVENLLPFRTLWYQIEPIQAYYELGNYDRVFEITNKILNNYNRAFSELYILRGNIYKNQENLDAARAEYEKAVFYNVNLKKAQESLTSLN